MARPRRRRSSSVSSSRPRSYSDIYRGAAAGADPEKQISQPIPSAAGGVGRGPESVDWKGEYAYVLNDLRNLLLITGVLFVAMVVIGFFI
jgi:hypothetical protein